MAPMRLEKSEFYSSIGQIHAKRFCMALTDGVKSPESGLVKWPSKNVQCHMGNSGEKNLIALACERTVVNEIGTGGLIGPVVKYQEK